jgi:hypothetical protein
LETYASFFCIGEIGIKCPEESVTVRFDLQDAREEDKPSLAYLGSQDLKHQLLTFEVVGIFDLEFIPEREQFG